MNPIKIISVVVVVLSIFTSCSKDDYKLSAQDIDPYVRFNLLVNSSNAVLEYPTVNSTALPVSSYTNKSIKPLKIPVTLTTATLEKPVYVEYSIVSTGDNGSFSATPKNQVSFVGNQLSDTIYLSFDKRWEAKEKITLKLESVSDPSVHIGNLNTATINNVIEINLDEVKTNFTFQVNRLELKGEVGEQVDFKVNFPNGFIPSEIENTNFFKFTNGFDYVLTHEDFGDNRSFVTYHLRLLENLQKDDVYYQTGIALVPNANYTTTGNTVLQVFKPIKTERDVQANPAAHFYDLSNQYYLTYGAHWSDKNGVCTWQSFNAFTFPVVVSKENVNAIQYSGQVTSTTSDDVYHDAFKIGFNVVSGNGTTNSFDLKRWFSNESTDAANSPGFNITSAIEFFPENGNSKTKGSVLVIPQDITIGGKNGNSYSIAIAGAGSYKEISSGLFEISFDLKVTNDALFGGTVTSQYKIYNSRTFPTVSPINEACITEIEL
ncbi:hypothetical protein [Flavobacterium degerlachei]|jgi:hypothetical protein|uniref:Uncharacterized protein n=1 Tax=Flavobacterium degerlachei TaxID=229203 RepID=A0A1H2WYW8_9FLAO|nr:hypothetical protein [Flavobacterium degerlachei]SDW85708.1 hypothetical protein SAMN05444338_10595 [Flavobacterium degerlachei]